MSKSGAIEAADEVFKHIAAVHGGNLVRAQVSLGGVELLDDQVQGVALHHALDDVVELKHGQHVLHVGGEAGEIVTEVGLDVLRVSQQRLKGVLGCEMLCPLQRTHGSLHTDEKMSVKQLRPDRPLKPSYQPAL